MKISVKQDEFVTQMPTFEGEEYVIDLDRKFEGYEEGDIVISGNPFDCTGKFPLVLELGIRKNGSLIFRRWSFTGNNSYFHVNKILLGDSFVPTEQQIDTVAGLFSGRIKFEGLRISVGASLQKICPIDIEKEEARSGKKIYLS
ncbi:hypothetical protein [Paenibacillus dendritiformis]|uniref:hypothetical protein n=1 Tax=Paenibacillus dendritiformis TaxID=130049 RepID=UPI00387E0CBD